jgi:phosphotransferase family enzyme
MRSRPSRTALSAGRDIRAALDTLMTGEWSGIVRVETRPLPYASSFAIEEVDVWFDDDSRIDLVCKATGDPDLLPAARRIKPAFLRNPFREIAVYESILQLCAVGAPRYYGGLVDRRRGQYLLFLERVNGRPLAEVGDFNVWLSVSSQLARLHAEIAPHAGRISSIAPWVPLIQYDAAFYRRWMRRARRFLLNADLKTRARLRWLASHYEAVVEEVAALPVALVHGEFYASNILIESQAGQACVRPLDWELAGLGCPLMDLAALTAGWADERRSELAFSYYAEVNPHASSWLEPDAFLRAIECCRVQLAVQCLGWARNWTPPRSHAQDWLGEALRAAERLGF